jgi:hypothetical protein
MAHFAKLDENNNVIDIVVVHNNELLDSDGIEQEQNGINFCVNWSGGHTLWKQTSYNNSFRKNYAWVGGTYDPELDAFIKPKPWDSWGLDRETCTWTAPIPMPTDDKVYVWNEPTLSWIELTP